MANEVDTQSISNEGEAIKRINQTRTTEYCCSAVKWTEFPIICNLSFS